MIGFLTFGLVTSPIWYQLAALKWHPFISHSGQAMYESNAWTIANFAFSGLFRDIGFFLPIGIAAFLAVVLVCRLDGKIFVPSLLFISIFAFFLMIRRWSPWYIVELLPVFAVITVYSLARVYQSSRKILRVCIIVGIIGVLVINSLAATSFVATFTANNSWKIVGGVAQGFAKACACPVVFVPEEREALWYFRDYKWNTLELVLQFHPNQFIMVATNHYGLDQINDYMRARSYSGVTYNELVLWHMTTYVNLWHTPSYFDELTVRLYTAVPPRLNDITGGISGIDSMKSGYVYAVPVKINSSRTVLSIGINWPKPHGGGIVQVALYSGGLERPGILLTNSPPVAVAAEPGWQDIPVSAYNALFGEYWLAFATGQDQQVYFSFGAQSYYRKGYGPFDATWSTSSSQGGFNYNMRVTYA